MLVLHNRALNKTRHLALPHHVTMNRIESHAARLLVLAALFVLAGCAGTHVKSVQTTPLATQIPAPRTVAVIVENVAPPLQDASAQKQQLNDANQVINRLNEGLIAFLKSRNLTIVSPAAHPDLTLHCNVLEVRGGTEWLRILIGYGAGRAALRTRVTLFGSAVTAQPLVIFETESTTGKLPGAGFGLASSNAVAAGGAALSIPAGLRQGLAAEANDSIEHIGNELGKYFKSQNWSSAEANNGHLSNEQR